MTIESNKIYYTGKRVNGYVTNNKLTRVEIARMSTMSDLRDMITALNELANQLTQDGVK